MSQAIQKEYADFNGVNLSLPYTKRTPLDADWMQDSIFLPSGSVCARSGWKYRTQNDDAIGYELYDRIESGVPTISKMIISDRLYSLIEGSVLITYTGAAAGASVTILYDEASAVWKFQILESASPTPVEKLNFSLGLGYEVGFVTLANLKTAVDGIAGGFYTATITGLTTTPAAFLPLLYREALSGAPGSLTLSISSKYRSAVRKPSGSSNNFAAAYANRNAASHRNATALNHRQLLYICTELDRPQKYDGTLVYNMGLPVGAITAATPTGVGAFAGSFNYIAQFSHRDAKLNYIRGSVSDIVPAVAAANVSVNLTVTGILNTSGYSTDYAQVNGAQAGVNTITVDAGYSLAVGDYVAILNNAAAGYLAREADYRKITAVAATTITIDGGVVTVSDNAIISQCLVLEIFRTKSTGSVFYALAKIPVLPGATITYVDSIADASLGEELIETTNFADPPPIGGVIHAHQGFPVITRLPAFPNRVTWEDPETPEGFPADVAFRDCYSTKGGVITGLWSNDSGMDVFFEKASSRLLGTLGDGQLELRSISKSVGLVHHHCAKELDNGYLAYLSRQGPRQMGPGGIPLKIGNSLVTLFKNPRLLDRKYVLERSLVIDNPIEEMCYFFLNCESVNGSSVKYSNTFSEVWVLDYQIQGAPRWVGPWKNVNMACGAVVVDGASSWIEKRIDTNTGNVLSHLIEMNMRKDDFDQIDHSTSLKFKWLPGFEDCGTKFIAKVYEYLKLYSADLQNQSGFTLVVKVEKNFNAGILVSDFVIEVGEGGDSAGFGLDPFGTFAFGNPGATEIRERIPCTEDADNAGNALRVYFEHSTLYSRPIISAFGLLVKVPYDVGYRSQ